MAEPPRRRRRPDLLLEEPPGGRRFPLWILFPVVIIVGLGLGAAVAHYIGSTRAPSVEGTPPPIAALPTETPPSTLQPIPTETPKPTSTARPTATPKPTATPSPQPTATAAPTASSQPTGTPQPSVAPRHTTAPRAVAKPGVKAAPRATAPVVTARAPVISTAAPVATAQPAAVGVVRAYLESIRRGNFAGAAQYLANGDPTETFIDAESRIGAYSSRRNPDGSYHVTADVLTGTGTYVLTFTVDNTDLGQRIIEHSAAKQ